MLDFDLKHARDANLCVVRLRGELDMVTVPEVKAALGDSLARGCDNVVMDLQGLTYADSSALSLLVWLDRALDERKGRLVLAAANANISRVLELSGLVDVAPTIVAAVDVHEAIGGLGLEERAEASLWEDHCAIPATPDALSDARSHVMALLEEMEIPESTLFDVRVATGEALANAIRHGSPGGERDVITVDVAAFPDRIEIVITDSGCGFDGTACANGDLYAESGRGVMFMKAFMDHVGFEALPDGGTSVTLVKHIPPRPA
ncbi:MAG TPA: anti-sigma factor antagonist [Coriobacteriia bacterium]|nr:anti-sigma factor antagonist [Coriobacteriia bacterium]